MNVNFELYKVFYFVAKTLSFSHAANELYISQSAVSQSIKTLEEKLGAKLFFRHTKLVKLTYEGKILFKHIEQAFNFIKCGERALQNTHSLKEGEVKIAASDTICKYYLLPYFKKFHKKYPEIKIRVINRPSPLCVEMLKKGNVDMSIVNLSHHLSDTTLKIHEMKKTQNVFIASKPFEHLKNKEISLKDLEEYPLLLLEKNSTTRKFFNELIQKHHVHISPEIELESIDLLVEMTKIGLGISFVMEDAIKEDLKREEVFILNIKEEIPKRSLGVMINNHIPLPIASKEFMNLLFNL